MRELNAAGVVAVVLGAVPQQWRRKNSPQVYAILDVYSFVVSRVFSAYRLPCSFKGIDEAGHPLVLQRSDNRGGCTGCLDLIFRGIG